MQQPAHVLPLLLLVPRWLAEATAAVSISRVHSLVRIDLLAKLCLQRRLPRADREEVLARFLELASFECDRHVDCCLLRIDLVDVLFIVGHVHLPANNASTKLVLFCLEVRIELEELIGGIHTSPGCIERGRHVRECRREAAQLAQLRLERALEVLDTREERVV
jgi:hypothetical protein